MVRSTGHSRPLGVQWRHRCHRDPSFRWGRVYSFIWPGRCHGQSDSLGNRTTLLSALSPTIVPHSEPCTVTAHEISTRFSKGTLFILPINRDMIMEFRLCWHRNVEGREPFCLGWQFLIDPARGCPVPFRRPSPGPWSKVASALKGDLVGEINAKRVWRNPNGKNFIGGRLIRMKVSHYSRFAITSWADFETFCLFSN
jgi:hypothetical protein